MPTLTSSANAFEMIGVGSKHSSWTQLGLSSKGMKALMDEGALAAAGLSRAASPKPPTGPWLAVFMDTGLLAVENPFSMQFLGDLERCVAWTADAMFHQMA